MIHKSPHDAVRRSARQRFRGIVVGLGMAVLLIVGAFHAQRLIAENYTKATLARDSAALTREFMRFEAARGRELALLPPPEGAARREIWARRIADRVNQPAAVCVVNGTVFHWLVKPHGFDVSADSAALLLAAPDKLPGVATRSKHGDIEVLQARFQPTAKDIHTLWLLRSGQDSLRWGVLLSSNDTWLAFYRDLDKSAAEDPEVGSPAWALQDLFSLPKSTTPHWNIGLRAFLHDSLIYASPGLDTTRAFYTYDFNGRKAQCYLSRWQEIAGRWIAMRYVFWPILLFPFLLIVLFYLDYRTIRRLTEPSKPDTV